MNKKTKQNYKLEELDDIDVSEDPVRPELDLKFRKSHGRKIYGLKNEEGEIVAIMCFAFTHEVPTTVEELDDFSKDCLLYTSPSPRDIS